ncbi:MAG: ABC transporter ATP-binding protein [Betaproteobacteria bacterium]|nr:MAG: ABC transporter ATP-binding protein [Betaproteobacteria bacterium]TMH52618.1 MAG: ABC transporter ATP-binding protein [Betaproteobacteria bacterium]
MSALLEMSGVTAGYAADIDVLRNVTLGVEAGRITGLIGLNGAGKSTLMKALCGFLRPKAGAVRYDGADVTGIAPHRLIDRGIGYIPQESSLFPYMSVADNLRLPLEHLARTRAQALDVRARIDEMLVHFPAIREKLRAQAGDLSGGQQKMLEFAKAYVLRPRLCLVDEPSIGLAPKIATEVYHWIDLFTAQGMTILLVDHNVRRVVQMSEYIYVLSLGEITAQGRRKDFEGDLHEQVRSWLGVNF